MNAKWNQFAEPLYNKILIGQLVISDLFDSTPIIRSIDFGQKKILCSQYCSKKVSQVITFNEIHCTVRDRDGKIEFACGYCGSNCRSKTKEELETLNAIWPENKWKQCRYVSDADHREFTRNLKELRMRGTLSNIHDDIQQHIDQIEDTYYVFSEAVDYAAKMAVEELSAAKAVEHLDRIPDSGVIYGFNLCQSDRKLFDYEPSYMDLFCVSLDRIFRKDFNALRLIVLIHWIKANIRRIGWKAALTPLNRLRSVLIEVNEEAEFLKYESPQEESKGVFEYPIVSDIQNNEMEMEQEVAVKPLRGSKRLRNSKKSKKSTKRPKKN